jgi:hypothetical protein
LCYTTDYQQYHQRKFLSTPNNNNNIQNKKNFMNTSKKHYSAPEATVVELVVEQGFSLSTSGVNTDNNIPSLDKWEGWED